MTGIMLLAVAIQTSPPFRIPLPRQLLRPLRRQLLRQLLRPLRRPLLRPLPSQQLANMLLMGILL